MRAARFGPFDAEKWWRPADLATLPAVTFGGTDIAAMDELLAGFCSPGDLLITRSPMAAALRDGLAANGIMFDHVAAERLSPDLVAGYAVQPYAVLPETVMLAPYLPAVDVVAEVNSKTWSNALAEELGLPGTGTVVRSVSELLAAIRLHTTAVVKDPYGVSGRAALVVKSLGVLRAIERTLAKQDKRIELLVQEKFDVVKDFSTHLEIMPDGHWRDLGVQEMTNRGFRHMGSGPVDQEFVDFLYAKGYFMAIDAVARALADAGYHGPAGVDSMLLRDGTLVPVLEVNARQSLGLLSLMLNERFGHARLIQLDLNVPVGMGIEALVGIPGVIVLNGSGLGPPGGRVYFALLAGMSQQAVVDAVTAAGMAIRGVAHAA